MQIALRLEAVFPNREFGDFTVQNGPLHPRRCIIKADQDIALRYAVTGLGQDFLHDTAIAVLHHAQVSINRHFAGHNNRPGHLGLRGPAKNAANQKARYHEPAQHARANGIDAAFRVGV